MPGTFFYPTRFTSKSQLVYFSLVVIRRPQCRHSRRRKILFELRRVYNTKKCLQPQPLHSMPRASTGGTSTGGDGTAGGDVIGCGGDGASVLRFLVIHSYSGSSYRSAISRNVLTIKALSAPSCVS